MYTGPLLELVHRAAVVHREFHDPRVVQVCRLVSVKTGGCPEDCAYCAQSSHYRTAVEAEPMLDGDDVMQIARTARARGVSRICLGAAWREVKDSAQFDRVLEMVKGITDLGLEVCCTLGMLNESQIRRLESAGLYAYNHNLDTSREHYSHVITTRTFEDRLQTLETVRGSRVTVCCGGILGLGESREDRIALLHTLASLKPYPESVPINLLSPVEGTPLAGQTPVRFDEVVRAVATARILMPRAVIRLSAGRSGLNTAEQALCFLAGANSIFSSDAGHMLTRAVPSPDYDEDRALLDSLGLQPRIPFQPSEAEAERREHSPTLEASPSR